MSSDQDLNNDGMLLSKYILEEVSWAVDDTVIELTDKDEKAKILKALLDTEEKWRGTISGNTVGYRADAPASWRNALCTWAYAVVDHFGLEREIVSSATDILDFVISSEEGASHTSKKDYAASLVASLYLTASDHPSNIPRIVALERRKLVDLCQGAKFQSADVEQAEHFIQTTLDGAAIPPTRLAFVTAFMSFCPRWKTDRSQELYEDSRVLHAVDDIARHLVEMSVFEPGLTLTYKPSVVAYSSILCAMDALQSHLDLPHYARVRYLNNVAEVSGLLPNSEAVLGLKDTLRDACPTLFNGDEFIFEFLNFDVPDSETRSGRSSPAGVLDH